jgi:hypothetical protein
MGHRAGILVGAALLIAYIGGYIALLRPADLTILDGETGCRVRLPAYRIGGPVPQTAFRPLLWIDQRVRPRYWAWESLPYGSNSMSYCDDERAGKEAAEPVGAPDRGGGK